MVPLDTIRKHVLEILRQTLPNFGQQYFHHDSFYRRDRIPLVESGVIESANIEALQPKAGRQRCGAASITWDLGRSSLLSRLPMRDRVECWRCRSRDGLKQAAEWIQPAIFKDRLPHQETNQAGSGANRAGSHPLRKRDSTQQRSTGPGRVLRAHDPNLEENIRAAPHREPRQGRRRKPRHINGGSKRQNPRARDNVSGTPVQAVKQQITMRRMRTRLLSCSGSYSSRPADLFRVESLDPAERRSVEP